MWHLIEDFFDQNLVMKGMIGFGWLCVLVMLLSLGTGYVIPQVTALLGAE